MSIKPRNIFCFVFYFLFAACQNQANEKLIANIDTSTWRPNSFTMSQDRRSVAYASVDRQLNKMRVVLNLNKGSPFDELKELDLTFSYDGKRLAYAARLGEKWFMVVDDKPGAGYDKIISDPVFSPDGTRLAYIAENQGQQLVIVDEQAGKPYEEITHYPHFSIDSKSIAYVGKNKEKKQVMILNSSELWVYDEIYYFTFSNTGKRFGYMARKEMNWFVVVDGKETRQDDPHIRQYGIYFSLDDSCYAYRTDKEIVMADGQEIKIYPFPAGYYAYDPHFSPDLKHFAYMAQKDDREAIIIDGKIAGEYDKADQIIYFSPDGEHLAYLVETKNKSCLILDGKEINKYDVINEITFSPDSKHLSYSAFKDGKSIIVIDDQESQAYDYDEIDMLQFSSDSLHLAYAAKSGQNWSIVIDGKIYPQKYDFLLAQTPVFSPDGKHVIYGASINDKWSIVVDQKQGKLYEDILRFPHTKFFFYPLPVVFDAPDRFHYLAKNGNKVFLIEEVME